MLLRPIPAPAPWNRYEREESKRPYCLAKRRSRLPGRDLPMVVRPTKQVPQEQAKAQLGEKRGSKRGSRYLDYSSGCGAANLLDAAVRRAQDGGSSRCLLWCPHSERDAW